MTQCPSHEGVWQYIGNDGKIISIRSSILLTATKLKINKLCHTQLMNQQSISMMLME